MTLVYLSDPKTDTDDPRVSIVIVNWNGKHHMAECLDSVAQQTYDDFEIIVVDNGSQDGSVDFIEQSYPDVRLVALDTNTGFASGNNAGLNVARGKYIVVLNNDTRAEEDWLERMVRVADAHPEVGMVGCRICAYDDPGTLDSLGMRVCRDGMSRGDKRLVRFADLTIPEVSEILFASACVALYRRDMIDEVGFFDDDFFAYAEDTDLGLRGRLAGWKALLARDAVVYHKYSMTGGAFSPFKIFLVERNHYWVAVKTFPMSWLLLVPFFTLVRFMTQGWAVFMGKGAGKSFAEGGEKTVIVCALLKGMLAAILGCPRMLRKRKQIMTHRRLNNRDMIKLLRLYHLSFRELLDY